ncbi:iron uptake transporter deferrochelatase/peroxidase subunit [Cytobacillus praedii]|uniref:iron uptake transporter deferrochelatase/peroxidase subunit n=1 Tax=Cytobacillus praedii TaxID=1742358 RepID=UPI002E1FB71C|nr:iron uptake transporter deferrochelatase/peroxidase subunit [Cytobacillus praedii]MED3572970.1 iron uptake transporter deferrochelatase/peroxidase subunit [Cytobacillus praedii]
MIVPNDEKRSIKKISRRDMLKLTGIGAAGAAIGASGLGGVMKAMGYDVSEPVADSTTASNKANFYGKHQSGITTPVQTNIYFASLDVLFSTKNDLQELFKQWTPLVVRLMNGELMVDLTTNTRIPTGDTGEAVGLDASNLTITIGVGPSLFDKLSIQHLKPAELEDLPHFPKDQLQKEFTGGDLCIQACADDPQVAFHAVRNLVRAASGKVQIKWSQAGFNSFPAGGGTPLNLFAFKDGTVNPAITDEKDLNKVVWVDKGWLKGGTYLVARKIQMHLETWDRTSLKDQEATFGRYRDSGAPFGKTKEFDDFDVEAKDSNGEYIMPDTSHVHLARKSGARILRRSYSYASGVMSNTGAHDAGLIFISFQKDPAQFTTVQNSLGRLDKMNEYVTHRGSAVFACFPGVQKGSYLGEALFNAL